MRFIELHAIAEGERLELTARIRQALGAAGAWITGHQEFSNISLCIRFEIDAARLPDLERELTATGARLDSETTRQFRQAAPGAAVAGTLQVAFIHTEPDLRQDIPAIPG